MVNPPRLPHAMGVRPQAFPDYEYLLEKSPNVSSLIVRTNSENAFCESIAQN